MSILEELYNEDILSVELSSDKMELIIMDACDYYYSKSLNKDQVGLLIKELQELKNQMV